MSYQNITNNYYQKMKGEKMRNWKCEFCGKGDACYLEMQDDKVPTYCVCEDAEYADWEEVIDFED